MWACCVQTDTHWELIKLYSIGGVIRWKEELASCAVINQAKAPRETQEQCFCGERICKIILPDYLDLTVCKSVNVKPSFWMPHRLVHTEHWELSSVGFSAQSWKCAPFSQDSVSCIRKAGIIPQAKAKTKFIHNWMASEVGKWETTWLIFNLDHIILLSGDHTNWFWTKYCQLDLKWARCDFLQASCSSPGCNPIARATTQQSIFC